MQLRQIDLTMKNIPTERVQQTLQQQASQQQLTCRIILLPKDTIRYIVNFLGYCNARSLNQTCKLS
jgi:hypothetical protein